MSLFGLFTYGTYRRRKPDGRLAKNTNFLYAKQFLVPVRGQRSVKMYILFSIGVFSVFLFL